MNYLFYVTVLLYYFLFFFLAFKHKNIKKLVFPSLVNVILVIFLMIFAICFMYPINVFSYLMFPSTFFAFILYNFSLGLSFEKLYNIKLMHYNIMLVATCVLSFVCVFSRIG